MFPLPLSWIGLIILTLFMMPLLAACGGSGSNSDSSQTMPTILMMDNTFNPMELHIKAGQTVLWVNKGQTIHTITADDNSFDSGNLNTGAQFRHTFKQPGRYPYYCQIHGGAGGFGMAGVIIVDSTSSTSAIGAVLHTSKSSTILRVPEDFVTIEAAVDAAKPGDMVSIAPNIYTKLSLCTLLISTFVDVTATASSWMATSS